MRDGRAARIICDTAKGIQNKPIVALVSTSDGIREYTRRYKSDGRYYVYRESEYDLINIPVVRKGWVNTYLVDDRLSLSPAYTTRNKADKNTRLHATRFACIEIEVTEGEGLEHGEESKED